MSQEIPHVAPLMRATIDRLDSGIVGGQSEACPPFNHRDKWWARRFAPLPILQAERPPHITGRYSPSRCSLTFSTTAPSTSIEKPYSKTVDGWCVRPSQRPQHIVRGRRANHPEAGPALRAKIFRFRICANQSHNLACLTADEGRSRSSRTRGGMRWTLRAR